MKHDAVHHTQRVFGRGVGDSPIPRGSTSMGPKYIATIIVKVQSVGIHVVDGGPFIYYLHVSAHFGSGRAVLPLLR